MKKTIKTRLLAGTILATFFVALPASATSLLVPEATTAMAQPSNDTETGEANAQKTPAPDTVDLAALYYYARNGETERVEAETRRLELKFPGFMPPADLYAPDAGDHVDEFTLWQLYERDDYAGIEQEISRIAASHPGWEPSQDFRASSSGAS
ncbi:MAG: hypothetical protein ACJLUP_12225 [Agrobacterium tumefaciens]